MEVNLQRAETLRALRQICRGTARSFSSCSETPARISTGLSALDGLLPEKGLEPGCLVEWMAPVEGCRVSVLALQGIQSALRGRQVWAVVDENRDFYPLAAKGWGISLESLLWIRPSSPADAAWSVEQCLRCPAVGVTWFQADRLSDRVVRRWKIAAEVGRGIGVIFRPAQAARNASWADVRWLVQPQPKLTKIGGRRLRVELVYCRGGYHEGGAVELEVCDATGHVRLVSTVAGATPAVRRA